MEAQRRGLDVARSTGLFSVVFNGDTNQLTSLRAVSEKYPLRGSVMLSDEPFGAPQPANGIPGARRGMAGFAPRGGARRERRHASSTSARSTFRVSRILITRPDQGATFLELAPSLIMNEADLAATQLIQPGSRLRRAQLFAGPRAEIAVVQGMARGQQEAERRDRRRRGLGAADQVGHRSLGALPEHREPGGRAAVRDRRGHGGAALRAPAPRFGRAAEDAWARRAPSRSTVSLVQLTIVGLLAAVLGSLLGFGAQAWLVKALAGLLRGDLPAARASRRSASASSRPSRCWADSRCRRCCSCRARRRCASCVATSGRRSRW